MYIRYFAFHTQREKGKVYWEEMFTLAQSLTEWQGFVFGGLEWVELLETSLVG